MKIEDIFARRNDFVDDFGATKWKSLNRTVILGSRVIDNGTAPVDFQAKLSLFGGGS
jgi:hypothetical protein